MKIKDCHVHAGGEDYDPKGGGSNSTIEGYLDKLVDLGKKDVFVMDSVAFAQPVPYAWLADYEPNFPLINYGLKNDEIGSECLSYDNMIFAVMVDPRDYRAGMEVERCVKDYDAGAVKVHFGCVMVKPGVLEEYEVVKTAMDYGLPLIIHQGPVHSSDLKDVIMRNGAVDFIIAHLGFLDDNIVKAVKDYDNAFLDTSAFTHDNFKYMVSQMSILKFIRKDSDIGIHESFRDLIEINLPSKAKLTDVIVKNLLNLDNLYNSSSINLERVIELMVGEVGSQKILFGSDEAWSPLEGQLSIIRDCSISSVDKDNIFFRNFDRLFN